MSLNFLMVELTYLNLNRAKRLFIFPYMTYMVYKYTIYDIGSIQYSVVIVQLI